MSGPLGYSLLSYARMVQCDVRMDAYSRALKAVIKPGCVVIDIGAGFGILSIIAAKLGAERVIAIEPDNSAFLIHDIAKANGVDDRIEVVHDVSTNFVTQERADIIVSDLRTVTPFLEYHIPSIVDARERLLKANGHLLPQVDRLKIALAQSPDVYAEIIDSWQSDGMTVDLTPVHRRLANSCRKVSLEKSELLSAPSDLAELDYRIIRETDIARTIELEAWTKGEVQGIAVWFETQLTGEISFSNAPGEPVAIYGQWFLPLLKPLKVEKGDQIFADISVRLIGSDYVWSWSLEQLRSGKSLKNGVSRQSSFYSKVLSPEKLHTRSHDHVPQPSSLQAIDGFVLSLIDGQNSLDDIAEGILIHFPGRFPKKSSALDHAAKVVSRYKNDAIPFLGSREDNPSEEVNNGNS